MEIRKDEGLSDRPVVRLGELGELGVPSAFEHSLIVDKDFGTEVILLAEGQTHSLLIIRPDFPTATIALTKEQFELLKSFNQPDQVHQEVERKWLVEDTSYILEMALKVEKINQGYIAISKDGSELRVREKGKNLYLTLKTEGTLSRGEVEITVSSEQFSKLWEATEGGRVQKTRYTHSGTGLGHEYPNSLKVEVDLFTEPSLTDGKVIVEIEFASAIEAAEFTPPRFFGAEVTSDSRYKNKSVARKGFPL